MAWLCSNSGGVGFICLITFHFYALEKEMATHSSVLAWRIPGTVETGGLPSVGSHRVSQTRLKRLSSSSSSGSVEARTPL